MQRLDHGRSIPAPLVRCLVLAAAVVGVCPGTAAAQTVVTIDIISNDFVNPAGNTHFDPVINVGDTVHWQWVNGFHSTTAAAGQADSWDSGVLSPSTPPAPPVTFDHKFLIPGTFNYYCVVHGFDAGGGQVGGMSGFIVVRPVPEPSLMLLAAGLASAGVAGWRRLARKAPDGTCDDPRSPGARSGGSDD
jgi:plastocyanin